MDKFTLDSDLIAKQSATKWERVNAQQQQLLLHEEQSITAKPI